jgi:hypothetical protein
LSNFNLEFNPMKNICFFLLLLSLSLSLKATHNRAAEISYKRIQPFTKTVNGSIVAEYNYSITIVRYNDYGSGIADRCVDTVYFGDGGKGIAPRVNGTFTCGCGSINGVSIGCGEIIVNQSAYVVKKNVYSIIHTYAGPGSFIIKSFDPARNSGIVNLPNPSFALAFYVEALLVINSTGANNSSSILAKDPTHIGIVNSCFTHNVCAYEEEGDSLSYELIECMDSQGQAVPGYFFPNSSSIDGKGLLSWCTPTAQGEYQFAIIVKEWRKNSCSGTYQMMGYVIRDFQVLIRTGVPLNFTGGVFADTCISAGSSLVKTFVCNSSSSVSVKVYGPTYSAGNSNAIITPTSGNSTFSAQCVWQTSCQDIRVQPYQVNMVFSPPGYGSPVYRRLNVRVLPPTPIIYSIQIDTSKVTLKWHSLKNCMPNLAYYKVYRKLGNSSWQHSSCESGVPGSSGFIFQSYISSSDSVHVDTDLWTMQNGSKANYIVTAVTWDCLESLANAIHTTSLIVGLDNINSSNPVVKIYPNPASHEIKVNINGLKGKQINAQLITIDGKILYDDNFIVSEEDITVPVEGLLKGIYFVQIKTENVNVRQKFAKD